MGGFLPWYDKFRELIEPSWPLLVALGFVIIGVTIYLMLRGDPVLLAGWLVYLFSP